MTAQISRATLNAMRSALDAVDQARRDLAAVERLSQRSPSLQLPAETSLHLPWPVVTAHFRAQVLRAEEAAHSLGLDP